MTKVEEVARAMWESIPDSDGPLPGAETWLGDYWRERARAAIEAMRVPSAGMLDAGAHKLTGAVASTCCHRSGGYGGKYAHSFCDCRESAPECWSAMFDAALQEGA